MGEAVAAQVSRVGTADAFGPPRARLALTAAVMAAAGTLTFVVAVRQGWGQRLDEALKAWWLPQRVELEGPARAVTRLLAAPLAIVTLAAGTVAVLRRRRPEALVVLVALVVGGPAVALLLKHELLGREVLVSGTFPPSNTLPSGHGTVLAVSAITLVWLAPRSRRGPALVVAALGTALGGIALLLAAVHRPSDVLAAFLLAGAWSAAVLALGGAVAGPAAPSDEVVERRLAPRVALLGGLLMGVGTVLAALAVLDRRDADTTTLAVFSGGLALVAGSALVVLAALAWAMGGAGVAPRDEPRLAAQPVRS